MLRMTQWLSLILLCASTALALVSVADDDPAVDQSAVRGVVRGTDGSPVAGAVIRALESGAFPATTVSDEQGVFSLAVSTPPPHLLAIEAVGRAPQCVEGASLDTDKAIVLEQGAVLTVALAPDDSRAKSGTVYLLPHAIDFGCRIPRDRLVAWLARGITDGEARWTSLAAGMYEVWVLDERSNPLPVKAGSVNLKKGDRERLTIAARIPPETTGTRDLAVIERAKITPDAPLFIRNWSPRGIPEQWQATMTAEDERWVIQGRPCSENALYTVEAGNGIASFGGKKCQGSEKVQLHPRTDLRLKLEPIDREALPSHVMVNVFPCDNRTSFFRSVVTPDENGVVSFGLPAGCGEASVQAQGFAPIDLGRKTLIPGTLTDLGTKLLHPGGRATVRVIDGRQGLPLPSVSISAIPVEHLERNAGQGQGVEVLHTSSPVKTNQDGWAELRSLPRGRFAFLMSKDGYTELSEIFEAEEDLLIDDLPFGPGASLSVQLPGSDGEEPENQYFIALVPAETNRWPRGLLPRATARAGERVLFDHLAPGAWSVQVHEREPGSLPQRIAMETVQVARHGIHSIEIKEPEEYRGRVTKGGIGVSGTVHLTSISNRSQIDITTNAQGEFSVKLPLPGDYSVDFTTRTARYAIVEPVRFDTSQDVVEIELPDGSISGRVVTAAGEVAPGVDIQARSHTQAAASGLRTAELTMRSSPDGSFLIDGLSEGEWTLVVEDGARGSARHTETITTGKAIQGVVLTLDPFVEIAAAVHLSSGTPASGATVFLQEPGVPPRVFTTESNGQFPLRIPRNALGQTASFVIVTADRTIAAMKAIMTDPLTLEVPAIPGNLYIRQEPEAFRAGPGRMMRIANQSGIIFGPLMVGRPEGDTLHLRLAPGPWMFVDTEDPADHARLFAGAPPQKWTFVTTIGPGETQVFDLRSVQAEKGSKP
ncbi:MAG TPA: carboxypeptidase-like regulatory domain-containing protein [Thermoanaerobaculia bacterium]|nr:carboxypeptidase-like regulatory domain-containing protein [Thermoanaerobaculia bacterium]